LISDYFSRDIVTRFMTGSWSTFNASSVWSVAAASRAQQADGLQLCRLFPIVFRRLKLSLLITMCARVLRLVLSVRACVCVSEWPNN